MGKNPCYLDHLHYDEVIAGRDARRSKPDGSPLLVFRAGVLPPAAIDRAVPALRTAARWSNNRRANSGLMGFFERQWSWDYCRITPFTRDEADAWADVQPLLRALDAVLRSELPGRYAAQKAYWGRTSPDFRIPRTAFTTVTVNATHRFPAHRDAGNLKAGFGVLAVAHARGYDGFELIFPDHRVAVDLRPGDVLLADVSEVHGNGPVAPTAPDPERLSVVPYYRRRMIECGSAGEEHDRATRRPAQVPSPLTTG